MKSVRARLTLFTMLVVAVALAGTGLALRARIRQNLYDDLDRQLSEIIASAREVDAKSITPIDLPSPLARKLPPPHATPGDIQNRMIQVLKTSDRAFQLDVEPPMPRLIPVNQGQLSSELPISDPPGAKQALSGSRVFRDVLFEGKPMRSVSAPVGDPKQPAAVVQALLPRKPIIRQLADLDRGLLMSLPLAVLVAAISGALLIGSAMRPLRKMTDSARKLDEDLSRARLPADGGDEFADLARTINEAFDRTAAAFETQRRFTADASHELRTPLASIKGNSGYLLHLTELPPDSLAAARGIDRSADAMARLIDDLLVLAGNDAGRTRIMPEPIDIGNLIEETVSSVQNRDGIEVETCLSAGEFVGDAEAVRRVTTNLLTNAIRHARSRVLVSASLDGPSLTLTVEDDGPGIAKEHLPRLGERFYRPDDSRTRSEGGFGLGLAIVKGLTAAHGGALKIESELGRGTRATATFRTPSPDTLY